MDNVKVHSEEGDFLSRKQKEVKQKIMEDMLSGMFDNLEKNKHLFNTHQSLTDVYTSILVMLNRELLVHFFINSNVLNYRKEFMKSIFATIKEEVDKKIKEHIVIHRITAQN